MTMIRWLAKRLRKFTSINTGKRRRCHSLVGLLVAILDHYCRDQSARLCRIKTYNLMMDKTKAKLKSIQSSNLINCDNSSPSARSSKWNNFSNNTTTCSPTFSVLNSKAQLFKVFKAASRAVVTANTNLTKASETTHRAYRVHDWFNKICSTHSKHSIS